MGEGQKATGSGFTGSVTEGHDSNATCAWRYDIELQCVHVWKNLERSDPTALLGTARRCNLG